MWFSEIMCHCCSSYRAGPVNLEISLDQISNKTFKQDTFLHWSLIIRLYTDTQIAKFMGPTGGPPGSCRPQMGPMLAPWTLFGDQGMAYSTPVLRHISYSDLTKKKNISRPHGVIKMYEVFFLSYCGENWQCYNRTTFRSNSRLAPSQWEMSLQSNANSQWLGTNLESDLTLY